MLDTGGPATLRRDAEAAVASLPPLLAAATRLAASVVPGVHGRRQPGSGETFWQFRPAVPGDSLRSIDWRRSARSRIPLVRETEWEAAQSVWLWVDDAQAMSYSSGQNLETKYRRAALLGLALAVLLIRSGERVGLLGANGVPVASGVRQLDRLAATLAGADSRDEYGCPPTMAVRRGGRVVVLSDFLGPVEPIMSRLRTAVSSGVSGSLVQVVDPNEEAYPYDGRVAFESMGGSMRLRTESARALAEGYQAALAEQRLRLLEFVERSDWRMLVHRTSDPAKQALVWLVEAVGDLR